MFGCYKSLGKGWFIATNKNGGFIARATVIKDETWRYTQLLRNHYIGTWMCIPTAGNWLLGVMTYLVGVLAMVPSYNPSRAQLSMAIICGPRGAPSSYKLVYN